MTELSVCWVCKLHDYWWLVSSHSNSWGPLRPRPTTTAVSSVVPWLLSFYELSCLPFIVCYCRPFLDSRYYTCWMHSSCCCELREKIIYASDVIQRPCLIQRLPSLHLGVKAFRWLSFILSLLRYQHDLNNWYCQVNRRQSHLRGTWNDVITHKR